jgi:hypothetical protein
MLVMSIVYCNLSEGPDNMANQKIVDYQGRKVKGEVVEFQPPPENFSIYNLADGTTIKLKTVLLEVVRVVGEYGPTGDPVYVFTAQQIVNTVSPEALKQIKH